MRQTIPVKKESFQFILICFKQAPALLQVSRFWPTRVCLLNTGSTVLTYTDFQLRTFVCCMTSWAVARDMG